jgi:hypothetical protein
MQWAKASSWFCDPPAFDEPPEPAEEPVDEGLLLHAAVSRARPAMAMTATLLAITYVLAWNATTALPGTAQGPKRALLAYQAQQQPA